MAITVGDLLVSLRGDTKQFEAQMTRVQARLSKMGNSLNRAGRAMTMRLSLPLMAIGGLASKISSEFDTSLAHIVGLVGVQREQVQAWREDILNLGPAYGKTANEMGRAMFFITSAGLRGSTALSALEASAKGAAAGLGETEIVADAATSAMNAYGEANLDAETAVATLVATVREGKAAANEIAPAIGKVLPVAAELGVTFDQVGASIAAMTRIGLDANVATTALRATFNAILKPTKQSRDAMEEFGLSAEGMRQTLREEGLIALLIQLRDTFGDNEEAMTRVFPNVRALTGVLSLVGKQAANTQKIFASMANTTAKDLNDAFDAVSETAGFKFKQAMASMNTLMVRLGDTLLPTIVPLVERFTTKIEGLASAFDRLNPQQKTWVSNLVLAGIAVGPMVLALGMFVNAANALIGVTGAMTAKIIASTVAMTANATAAGAAADAAAIMGAKMVAARLGVAGLGLAIGYAIGTYFRPGIEALLGLDDAAFKFAKTTKDINAALAGGQEQWNAAFDAYDRLRVSLGLSGREWEVINERTKVNAARLSDLTQKAIALARERKKLTDQIKNEELPLRMQMTNMLAKSDAAQEKANAAELTAQEAKLKLLKEEMGLFSKGDIKAGLEDIVANFNLLKDTVDATQLGEKFEGPMQKFLQLAKENNVELPEGFDAVADALKGKINPEINTMVGAMHRFRTDATLTGKMLDGIFFSTGQKVETELSGGFARGVAKGVEAGKATLQDFVKRIENDVIYIPVQPSFDEWNQAVNDHLSGRVPDTGG